MNLGQSPLSSNALTSLREQMRVSQRQSQGVISLHEPPFFAYKPRGVSGEFSKLCRRTGIDDFHFHDLRHEATSRLKFRIHPPLEGLRTNYLYMKQIVELSCSSYGWCLQANGLTVGNGTILAHFPTTPSGHNLGNLEGVSVQRTSSATTEISRWLTK
jgi:hypothetical protein